MNIVSVINGEALTTSLAIAEGVGNPHKHVIRLVRDNVADLEEFGGVSFQNAPFKTAGGTQHREVAFLNEQQSTLLMTYMRNNDVVRAFKKRLVKAFYELATARPMPQDLSRLEILQMAMEAEKEKLLLKQEVEEMKPKADFHDKVVKAPDAISIAEAAKIIGTGRNRFLSFLRQIGWVTRHNEPYQQRIEQGYLDVKLGSWEHPDHGLQQSVTALVTGKGLARLQVLWSEHQKRVA